MNADTLLAGLAVLLLATALVGAMLIATVCALERNSRHGAQRRAGKGGQEEEETENENNRKQ